MSCWPEAATIDVILQNRPASSSLLSAAELQVGIRDNIGFRDYHDDNTELSRSHASMMSQYDASGLGRADLTMRRFFA